MGEMVMVMVMVMVMAMVRVRVRVRVGGIVRVPACWAAGRC